MPDMQPRPNAMKSKLPLLTLFAIAALSCGEDPIAPSDGADTPVSDTGTDGSAADGGEDVSGVDTGSTDSGATDTGEPDTGPDPDAGEPDALESDAAPDADLDTAPDAEPDTEPDTGEPDAAPDTPDSDTGTGGGECDSNTQCAPTDYCFHDGCEGTGVCVERPELCPLVWDPVCGCDGMTYGNSCDAAGAGVNVKSTGECPPED